MHSSRPSASFFPGGSGCASRNRHDGRRLDLIGAGVHDRPLYAELTDEVAARQRLLGKTVALPPHRFADARIDLRTTDHASRR